MKAMNLKTCCVGVLAAAALLVWPVHRGFQNYRGYCAAQEKYFSDQDFIHAAISHDTARMGLDGSPGSIDQFIHSHPHCCRVERHVAFLPVPWHARLIGFDVTTIELTFKLTADDVAHGLPYYREEIEVMSCGARGDMRGESIEAPDESNRFPHAVGRAE